VNDEETGSMEDLLNDYPADVKNAWTILDQKLLRRCIEIVLKEEKVTFQFSIRSIFNHDGVQKGGNRPPFPLSFKANESSSFALKLLPFTARLVDRGYLRQNSPSYVKHLLLFQPHQAHGAWLYG
jgi:hypothetical protein